MQLVPPCASPVGLWVPPLGKMRPLPATASQGKSPVPPCAQSCPASFGGCQTTPGWPEVRVFFTSSILHPLLLMIQPVRSRFQGTVTAIPSSLWRQLQNHGGYKEAARQDFNPDGIWKGGRQGSDSSPDPPFFLLCLRLLPTPCPLPSPPLTASQPGLGGEEAFMRLRLFSPALLGAEIQQGLPG